jgi:anaerobic selenocysteine-containing dehydrogenase
MLETRKSYCRFCHAYCGIEVDVEDERVVAVRGDVENPISGGYTCIKGRNMPEHHNAPSRLRSSMKRMPDGTFTPISSEQAMDEIAGKLGDIVARHGPRAVATFNGTAAHMNATVLPIVRAWHKAIGSPSYYTASSIDQPGKAIAATRHGIWEGGDQPFASADVFMMVGANPVVSMWAGLKFPAYNPWKRLRAANARGMKLIVIDPQKSEVAKRADIHLQLKPGEDPALLAGILHVILEEGLYDGDFCAANVDGLEELRQAVKEFTPEYVEQRARVPAALVERAARVFAAGERGMCTSGTGPSMAPRGTLAEQLVVTLNTLCGRYTREGERVANPGVLTPLVPRRAQAMLPKPTWGSGERSRVRGLGAIRDEMPTTALADEILLPGDGQVRALISVAGNPVLSWPDQQKTIAAMRALELSVAIDCSMSATARLCDYVIAPRLSLERADATFLADLWFPEPFAQYTPSLVEPSFDVIHEWEFFWGLAQRMRTPMMLPSGPLALDTKPATDDVLDLIAAGSRVPLSEVRTYPGGHVFEDAAIRVQPRLAGTAARFQAGHPAVVLELAEIRGEFVPGDGGYGEGDRFTHRLIGTRLRDVFNSSGCDLPSVKATRSFNPAHINPLDLDELGVTSGDLIEITSDRSSILGVAVSSDDVPSGVVAMAHSWGDTPDHDHRVREIGSNTNRLISTDRDYDPITGMARQTAIPVNLRAVREPVPT